MRVTLGWTDFMGDCNTPGTVFKDMHSLPRIYIGLTVIAILKSK